MHTISNASQINLSVFFERFDETWLGWRQGNAYLHIWSSNVRCCRLYFRQSLSTSWDPAIQWPDKTFLRERVTWPQTTRLNQLLFSTRGETVGGTKRRWSSCFVFYPALVTESNTISSAFLLENGPVVVKRRNRFQWCGRSQRSMRF